MRLGGNIEGPQPLRLGLSTLFLRKFIKHQTPDTLADIFIHADHSIEIAKGLIDGYIDVGCIFENSAFEAGIGELVVNKFRIRWCGFAPETLSSVRERRFRF